MIEEKETFSKELDEGELLKRLRRIRIANIWTVRVFFAVFFAIAVIAFIVPLRPAYSDAEKRELEKFPEFSLSSLFSGEYFIGIDKWYSDTFPARDSITDLNTRVTMLFGKNDVQIHGEVEEGDVIPSVEESVLSEEELTSSKENATDKAENSSDDTVSKAPSSSQETSLETSNPVSSSASSIASTPSGSHASSVVSSNTVTSSAQPESVVSSQIQSSASSEKSSAPGSTSQNSSQMQSNSSSSVSSAQSSVATKPTVPPQSSAVTSSVPAAPTTQTLGALLINGDTAYEYYNFSRETADKYVAAVNRAAALLNGKAQVFDMIIPTSMGITAPVSLVSSVNTSDQKKAIDYMHSQLKKPVKFVPLYNMLKSHSKEYIYFRTDHHWTALGAYYSYCELMKSMGVTPNPLESYVKHEFTGFLGSFYTSSGKLPQLSAKPDTVYAYQPAETNSIKIRSNKGVWYNSNIISDMSTASASNKYITFIKGDNAHSVINNPNVKNGKVCLVIKESFGNAFVPFLVPHYQYVYILDYRYFNKIDNRGLVQFQIDSNAKDVIFINNISATRNKTLVGYIDDFVR